MAYQVICFGEVLWDFLPQGKEPGGAPMNVTYHLNKSGVPASLISKVGKDDLGDEILKVMFNRRIPTPYIEVDAAHETGKVYANTDKKEEVKYTIVEGVAWDYIEYKPEFETILRQAKYFVYGSLAAREKVSRDTLLKLLEAAPIKVFDVNLRAPHYTREGIEMLMQKADLLKLNDAELEVIGGWLGNFPTDFEKMEALAKKFSIDTIVVTLGAKGAALLTHGRYYEQPGFKVQVADTVGSGDAFLAGFLSALLNQQDPQSALRKACALGAIVAQYAGGCPEYNTEESLELL